jgi:hypothetical protein
VPLEELEIHLREEVERQMMKLGADEQQVFEIAAAEIGQAKSLKMEFRKVDAENWNRPLAWVAWVMFVVSFFLPALMDGYGWQCAGLAVSAITWPDTRQGNWMDIHLASLTLTNLLMIASPFLLMRFSSNLCFMKWWRGLNFSAVILVWSFIVLLLLNADGKDLKIGCYIWATSFLLLCLSALKNVNRKMPLVKYV